MAELMLFLGKAFPFDSSGVYVEGPEGIARDNGSAFLDRQQVFDATGQLTGPGVLTVLDVQCDQSLATGAGKQESRVIVGEAAEGTRAGGRIERGDPGGGAGRGVEPGDDACVTRVNQPAIAGGQQVVGDNVGGLVDGRHG